MLIFARNLRLPIRFLKMIVDFIASFSYNEASRAEIDMRNDYLELRQEMTQLGYDNDKADDVKDFFVAITKNFLSDAQINQAYINYREYETANPEYKQHGDSFITF